ncbi:hypothetical protein PR048_014570 [Dryococelus australis]|uniref:Uncharacterized protein n=1 Tax=Dryococelus australis TaxID=614101 RepID=A0ABQ9HEU0_9NEOP|nr:hypothetical protein PR048_014570 [Dryococelus australis]
MSNPSWAWKFAEKTDRNTVKCVVRARGDELSYTYSYVFCVRGAGMLVTAHLACAACSVTASPDQAERPCSLQRVRNCGSCARAELDKWRSLEAFSFTYDGGVGKGSGRLLATGSLEPKRLKRRKYGSAPECKVGGNGRLPRKPAVLRHRPARCTHAKLQERPLRESNRSSRWATAAPSSHLLPPEDHAKNTSEAQSAGFCGMTYSSRDEAGRVWPDARSPGARQISISGDRPSTQLNGCGNHATLLPTCKGTCVFPGVHMIATLFQFASFSSCCFFCKYSSSLFTFTCGAAVAERSACSPPTMAIRAQFPAGSLRILARGNRAERCRWSAGFLGNLPFPSALSLRHCPIVTTVTLRISSLHFTARSVHIISSTEHFKIPTTRCALSGDGVLDTRGSIALTPPAALGLKRGTKFQVDPTLELRVTECSKYLCTKRKHISEEAHLLPAEETNTYRRRKNILGIRTFGAARELEKILRPSILYIYCRSLAANSLWRRPSSRQEARRIRRREKQFDRKGFTLAEIPICLELVGKPPIECSRVPESITRPAAECVGGGGGHACTNALVAAGEVAALDVELSSSVDGVLYCCRAGRSHIPPVCRREKRERERGGGCRQAIHVANQSKATSLIFILDGAGGCRGPAGSSGFATRSRQSAQRLLIGGSHYVFSIAKEEGCSRRKYSWRQGSHAGVCGPRAQFRRPDTQSSIPPSPPPTAGPYPQLLDQRARQPRFMHRETRAEGDCWIREGLPVISAERRGWKNIYGRIGDCGMGENAEMKTIGDRRERVDGSEGKELMCG